MRLVVDRLRGAPAPPPPTPPSGLTLQPDAAAVGDTLVITGSDLGRAGTLTVGGVEAEVQSWAEDRVEVVVAAGTPAGPQAVVLTADNGTANAPELLVGAAYGGSAADLQAFVDGLAPGVAVRLAATTYTLTSDLRLDNHGLYGQGVGATTLDSQAFTVTVLADAGQDLEIADMSIATDAFFLYGGGVDTADGRSAVMAPTDGFRTRTISLLATDTSLPAHATQDRPLRLRLPSALLRVAKSSQRTSGSVGGAGAPLPTVRLRDLDITEVSGAQFGVPISITSAPAIGLRIQDVTFVGPNSAFTALGTGPV